MLLEGNLSTAFVWKKKLFTFEKERLHCIKDVIL